VNTLAIDTCERRGSVAVRRDGRLVSVLRHESVEDYSSWLLPAVENCLGEAGITLKSVDLLAAATGPGSFTGLRVGLTTVKAWAELYGKPIVGVSRLEVLARCAGGEPGFVAASFDAQRGQAFGGLYGVNRLGAVELMEQEMVTAPEDFVRCVHERVGEAKVRWATPDAEMLEGLARWTEWVERGDVLVRCDAGLAAGVAELGEQRARSGETTDSLRLDANYVRRSDAEIFWKDPASHGR
jgi:tRNA threonylcarbamoyladenosine biosynthesis protein TsaB